MNFGFFYFCFRVSLGHIMAKRGKYTGSSYSIDVKEALGAIGHGLREEGWTVSAVHDLYKRAGFSVGEETLRGWTQAVERGEPVISPAKQAGAEKGWMKSNGGCSWLGFARKKKNRPATLHRICKGQVWSGY
jgi:hypothetical protein